MTLKTCSCGKIQTTKNALFIGRERTVDALYFNCSSCNSTFLLMSKKAKEELGLVFKKAPISRGLK